MVVLKGQAVSVLKDSVGGFQVNVRFYWLSYANTKKSIL